MGVFIGGLDKGIPPWHVELGAVGIDMLDIAFIIKPLVGESKGVFVTVVALMLVDAVASKAKWVFIIVCFKNG